MRDCIANAMDRCYHSLMRVEESSFFSLFAAGTTWGENMTYRGSSLVRRPEIYYIHFTINYIFRSSHFSFITVSITVIINASRPKDQFITVKMRKRIVT